MRNASVAGERLTATLNEATTDSFNTAIPADAVCTLTDPASFTANGLNTFTAPTSGTLCPTLDPNTTYFFALERSGGQFPQFSAEVTATNSDAEDPGGRAGWTIANIGRLFNSVTEDWTVVFGQSSYLIVVRGENAAPNNPATGTASIRGAARAGELLRARLSGLSDADGIPSGVAYTYQWLLDGAPVAGADGPAYLPWDEDIGKAVRVRVRFTDSLGHIETLTSAATAAVAASPHGQVIWSATLTVGEHAIAHGYSTISAFGDMQGQTLSDDAFIHRTTTHTVIHVDSERGAVVTGRDLKFAVDPAAPGTAPATWTLLVGNAEFHLSDADASEIGANDAHTWENASLNWTQGDKVALGLLVRRMAATGRPSITGIAVVDQTLTADLTGISDANGIDESTLVHRWVSVDRGTDTDIPGATGSVYTVKQEDLGKRIKVRVSFTDGDGYEEGPLESLAVGPVEGVLPPTVDYFSGVGTYQDAISVAWSSVRGAAEYKLEMRKQGEEEWTRITRGDFDHLPSTTDYRLLLGIATGLECGKTYDFRISLRGDGTTFATLFGPYAETTVPLTAMVGLPWTACPKPDQPTNIRVLEEPDCATLTWTPPTNDDWTGVRIRRLTLVADTRGGPGWETIYERLNDSRTRYQDCRPRSGTAGYGVEGNACGYSVYYIKEEDGVIRQSRRTARGFDYYGPSQAPDEPRNVRFTRNSQGRRTLAWYAAPHQGLVLEQVLGGRGGSLEDPWLTGYMVERRLYDPDRNVFAEYEDVTLLSATLTVGSYTPSHARGYTSENLGFSLTGALDTTEFTHPSGAFEVTHLLEYTSTSQTPDRLELFVHPSPPDEDVSNWILVIDGEEFPLAEAVIIPTAVNGRQYRWENTFTSWDDGEPLSVKLIERRVGWQTLREGDDGNTRTSFTDNENVGDKTYAYRVRAVNVVGASSEHWEEDWLYMVEPEL